MNRVVARWAVGAMLVVAGTASHAAWNFESASVSWSGKGTTSATASITSDGVTATASAFSVANVGTGTGVNGRFNTGTDFARAQLQDAGLGLGVRTTSESTGGNNHATDNTGWTEMILFSFDAKVILDSLTLGWGGDSDITLLRYTGNSAPTVAGNNWSELKLDGWEVVGDYYDVPINSAKAVNADDKYSSWWIVSAYNSTFSGGSKDYNGNDYFKLASLGGTVVTTQPPPGEVPEPGSLALMGLALAGFVAVRRRGGRAV